MPAKSRDCLEDCLSRIADPSGEGARACLTVYGAAARAAADAADARAAHGISLGPLDGTIVTIKDLFDVAGEVTRAVRASTSPWLSITALNPVGAACTRSRPSDTAWMRAAAISWVGTWPVRYDEVLVGSMSSSAPSRVGMRPRSA